MSTLAAVLTGDQRPSPPAHLVSANRRFEVRNFTKETTMTHPLLRKYPTLAKMAMKHPEMLEMIERDPQQLEAEFLAARARGMAKGAEQERERVRAILDLAGPGSPFSKKDAEYLAFKTNATVDQAALTLLEDYKLDNPTAARAATD